jgi:thiol-disulfide isomerase/thioredoxin
LARITNSSLPRPICSETTGVARCLLLAVLWLVALPAPALDEATLGSLHMQRLDEAAPDFQLRDASGDELRLTALRGRPVILHFWATWCEPCREELPALETIARRLADSGAILVAVAIDDEADAARIRRYAQDLGVTFPVYLAREGDISERFWSWGVPVTYLIDPAGRLVARSLGPRDWTSAAMQAVIEQFVGPAKPVAR